MRFGAWAARSNQAAVITGNMATEDLVDLFESWACAVDLDGLAPCRAGAGHSAPYDGGSIHDQGRLSGGCISCHRHRNRSKKFHSSQAAFPTAPRPFFLPRIGWPMCATALTKAPMAFRVAFGYHADMSPTDARWRVK